MLTADAEVEGGKGADDLRLVAEEMREVAKRLRRQPTAAAAQPEKAPASTCGGAHSDPVEDGPMEGLRFAWKGTIHKLPGNRPWSLVDALWQAGERGMSVDTLNDVVWERVGLPELTKIKQKISRAADRALETLCLIDPRFDITKDGSCFKLVLPAVADGENQAKAASPTRPHERITQSHKQPTTDGRKSDRFTTAAV